MDWLLVFTIFIPLLPGVVIGLLVRIWARDERSAFLAELAIIGGIGILAAVVWESAYWVLGAFWMILGAQIPALLPRRRAST